MPQIDVPDYDASSIIVDEVGMISVGGRFFSESSARHSASDEAFSVWAGCLGRGLALKKYFEQQDKDKLGKAAFDAYFGASSYEVAFKWDRESDIGKKLWTAAAQAVVDACR